MDLSDCETPKKSQRPYYTIISNAIPLTAEFFQKQRACQEERVRRRSSLASTEEDTHIKKSRQQDTVETQDVNTLAADDQSSEEHEGQNEVRREDEQAVDSTHNDDGRAHPPNNYYPSIKNFSTWPGETMRTLHGTDVKVCVGGSGTPSPLPTHTEALHVHVLGLAFSSIHPLDRSERIKTICQDLLDRAVLDLPAYAIHQPKCFKVEVHRGGGQGGIIEDTFWISPSEVRVNGITQNCTQQWESVGSALASILLTITPRSQMAKSVFWLKITGFVRH